MFSIKKMLSICVLTVFPIVMKGRLLLTEKINMCDIVFNENSVWSYVADEEYNAVKASHELINANNGLFIDRP